MGGEGGIELTHPTAGHSAGRLRSARGFFTVSCASFRLNKNRRAEPFRISVCVDRRNFMIPMALVEI